MRCSGWHARGARRGIRPRRRARQISGWDDYDRRMPLLVMHAHGDLRRADADRDHLTGDSIDHRDIGVAGREYAPGRRRDRQVDGRRHDGHVDAPRSAEAPENERSVLWYERELEREWSERVGDRVIAARDGADDGSDRQEAGAHRHVRRWST